MKAHLAKLSLALLSTVFLLGCQEQGSEPVGPEGLGPQFHGGHLACEAHNKNDPECGGGAEGTLVEVTLTGHILSGPQPARLTADNRTKVTGFSCCEQEFFGELKLTLSPGDLAACTVENTSGEDDVKDRLVAFLTKVIDQAENDAGEVTFGYRIQLRKENGGLSFGWTEPEFKPDGFTPNPDVGRRVRVDVRSDNVTHDGTQTTFTFVGDGGGVEEISVKRSILGGTLTERDRLICQKSDLEVVLELDRSPS